MRFTMNYGDLGISFLTGVVTSIVKAEQEPNGLKVTFFVSRKYGATNAYYLVSASDKYIPWIRKLKVSDHVVMVCYMNFINAKSEDKKATLTLSPTTMFVINDKIHERPDSIIVKN
jgi:hypothetical protein